MILLPPSPSWLAVCLSGWRFLIMCSDLPYSDYTLLADLALFSLPQFFEISGINLEHFLFLALPG